MKPTDPLEYQKVLARDVLQEAAIDDATELAEAARLQHEIERAETHEEIGQVWDRLATRCDFFSDADRN